MIHPLEVIGEIRDPARELREQIPDVLAGYAAMQRAVITDGALPARIKGADRPGDRGDARVRRLHRRPRPGGGQRNATEEEVAEAMGVAIMMNGGPGTVWAPRAFAAFREVMTRDE